MNAITPAPKEFSGFDSWQELARMVWECDADGPENLKKYLDWKHSDRTKAGLLALPKRSKL